MTAPVPSDLVLLRAIEEEIPILEDRLRTMKITRKRLKAAQQMRAKWKDPAFRARARLNGRDNHPIIVAYNAARALPWPENTTPYKRYRALMRKGWTRELAIEKIHAEAVTPR